MHSLHAYFVRPGDSTQPIVYTVDRIRDGRSFSVRRAVAYQYDKPIFFMSASAARNRVAASSETEPSAR